MVLHPDVDSSFVDQLDVIRRLLPYHLFQHPKEDLDAITTGKGKEKAVEQDWREEIQGMQQQFNGYYIAYVSRSYEIGSGYLPKT